MFLNKDTKPKTEQNNKKTTALSDEEIERAYREYMNSDYSQLSTPRKQTTKTSPPEKTYPQAPVPQVNSNDSTNLQPATEEQ